MSISRKDIRWKWLKERGFDVHADPLQLEYMQSLWAPPHEIRHVICEAPAGTGKTQLAVLAAVYAIDNTDYDTIMYIRNAVPLREQGFLTGDLGEKEAPYMKPFVKALNKVYPDLWTKWNRPMFGKPPRAMAFTPSYERGDTYERAFVILDEAQSWDLVELQTIYTRCADSCKIVTCGSLRQNDNLKQKKIAGLTPLEVYMEHFKDDPKTAQHTLVTNYRGEFSQLADKVMETVVRLEAAKQR